jgi:hypothetical protein
MRHLLLVFVLTLLVPLGPAKLKPCPSAIAAETPPAQQQGRPGAVDARASARDAKGTAVIRGRVTAADTGRPLRRASVTATADVVRRSAYTDENGQFEWKDLPAGKYRVRASVAGYVALDFGEDPDEGGGRDIALNDGETFDRAEVRLPRGGVITGRVMDEVGEAVEGVQVQALTVEYVAGMERLSPTSYLSAKRSNDIGRYRIYGLVPGQYYVAATPGPFTPGMSSVADMASGYIVTYYPGTADTATAQMVTVSAAQETQADIALVPSWTFDLSGVAIDFSGTPLASASLLLLPGTSGAIGVMARAGTAADGTFKFSGIAPGPYVLQMQPLPSPPPPPGASAAASGSRPTFASLAINVVADMSGIVLQGRPPRTATGEIVIEGGSPGFKPQDLQIAARPLDFTRSPIIGYGFPGRINDDWTFELRDLWGPRLINVAAPSGWGLKAVRLGGVDMTDKPIDFERESGGRLQIVMTSQVTELSGIVTSEGRAVPRIPVIVFASDSSRWDFQSRFLKLVTTDENGRFTASALPAADYRVIALPRVRSGFGWQRPQFLEPLVRDSVRVTLHDGERANVDLRLTKTR